MSEMQPSVTDPMEEAKAILAGLKDPGQQELDLDHVVDVARRLNAIGLAAFHNHARDQESDAVDETFESLMGVIEGHLSPSVTDEEIQATEDSWSGELRPTNFRLLVASDKAYDMLYPDRVPRPRPQPSEQ